MALLRPPPTQAQIKYGKLVLTTDTRKKITDVNWKSSLYTVKKKIGRQLDYIHILVSTRWKSCVTRCKSKWGPSVHRDIHSEHNDHALVECKWSWHIRFKKSQAHKDFSCLFTQEHDAQGNPLPSETMQEFEHAVQSKLTELVYPVIDMS